MIECFKKFRKNNFNNIVIIIILNRNDIANNKQHNSVINYIPSIQTWCYKPTTLQSKLFLFYKKCFIHILNKKYLLNYLE